MVDDDDGVRYLRDGRARTGTLPRGYMCAVTHFQSSLELFDSFKVY